jgi:RimJ/RimL family protein N-acetyltransferase
MKIIIETQRLYLREMEVEDQNALTGILCDSESMKYYPRAFSINEVKRWIDWNIDNYKRYGHGLWAVIKKDNDCFIGDCGITIQNIERKDVPEIGYHINRQYLNKGYATEAAKACIDYGFEVLNHNELFSYTKIDNVPSIRVAEKNGMLFRKKFSKEVMGVTVEEVLYSIRKDKM